MVLISVDVWSRYVPMFGETEFHPDRCYAAAPLDEQLEALAGAQHAGQIRHYGLSNETPWGLMEACRLGMLPCC